MQPAADMTFTADAFCRFAESRLRRLAGRQLRLARRAAGRLTKAGALHCELRSRL
jgi:hypothetical protein